MQIGDQLILTKRLGTGVLLAAVMRAACKAEWYMDLMKHLTKSNQWASEVAAKHELQAVTDVTGFGLAGHLLEVISASDVNASVDLSLLQLLPGVDSLIQAGILSSLDTANRAAEAQIETDKKAKKSPSYQALFDPQTSGGMLLSVPESKVTDVLADLPGAFAIGSITEKASESPKIIVA